MYKQFGATISIMALLAGCSSDSPDDCGAFSSCSSTGGSTGSAGLISLTRDNALDTLREAWFGATVTADVPAFVVATGIGDTSGGTVFVSGAASKLAPRNTVAVDPFGPTTYNCPVSGTFIVTGDVTDPLTITAGDFVSYDSSACDSGTGFTVDGTHSILIASVGGDVASGMYEQAQLLTFTDFMATSSTLVTTFNGDHMAIIDTRAASVLSTTFSGNQLSFDEQQINLTIRNFSGFVSIETATPFISRLSATGTANSSLIQGSFDYYTEEIMQKPMGGPPTDGIFNIIGANNSTARVAVVDATLVRVQLDENNSGNFEVSTDMTWDEFLNGSVVLGSGDNLD